MHYNYQSIDIGFVVNKDYLIGSLATSVKQKQNILTSRDTLPPHQSVYSVLQTLLHPLSQHINQK